MVARCPQRVHSSMWPPRAAVRQRAMASRTLIWVQRIHRRVGSVEAGSAGGARNAPPQGGRPLFFSRFGLLFLPPAGRRRGGGGGGGWGKGGAKVGFFLC